MGNHFRRRFQNLIVAGLVSLALVVLPAMVTAAPPGAAPLPQGTKCYWENPCTPTPDPSLPTATATATVDPSATATATSEFDPDLFRAPEYGIPTGIPTTNLYQQFPAPTPWINNPIPAPSPINITINPIATPSFPTVTLSIPATYTVAAISGATIPISLTVTPAPYTSTFGSTISNTASAPFSGTVYSLHNYADGIYSYTNTISGNIAALQGTATITVITAPAWYAPDLPRPFANVGWTFEQQISPNDTVPKFTTESWAAFVGYILSLPFAFIRMIWVALSRFGPFGLFLAWLVIMAAFVFSMEFINFFIRLFAVTVRFIVRLAELLGEWVPTGG